MRAPSRTSRPAALALALAPALALSALSGCDAAIDLRLVATDPATDVDLSCVTSVEVSLVDPNGQFASQCVDVPAGTVRSLADHGLDGIIDLPIPPWTPSGVRVIASAGHCQETVAGPGGVMFSGAAPWRARGEIALPITANLDCRARTDTPTTVHVLDLEHLFTATPCAPPDDARVGTVALATLSPTGDVRPYYAVGYDLITDPSPVASGTASLRGAYTASLGATCLAALTGAGTEQSLACVYPGPGACARAGELETIYMPISMVEGSIESDTFAQWGSVAFGVVWDTATGKPLAGAHVAADDDAGARVVYTQFTSHHFVNRTADTTGADGSFKLFAAAPTTITISAPGHRPRTVALGGFGHASLVALDPL